MKLMNIKVTCQAVTCNDITDFSDSGSVAGSEVDKNFDDSITNQLFTLFTTDAKEEIQGNEATKRKSATNAEKRAKLPNKIFNYIHSTKCRRLFLQDWYDDVTYAPREKELIKALPNLCSNRSSCQSPNPKFLKRPPFINTTPAKYKESNQK